VGSRYVRYFLLLLAVALASRLLTTIYYIEDPDSLRFALSVYDEFSVSDLQPHFPGYPVFWVLARGLYLATGHLAVSFSILGGFAAAVIAFVTVRLTKEPWTSPTAWLVGAVVLGNPLLWLMGNRYMPDLLGLAGILTAFYLLVVRSEENYRGELGMGLAGLTAGLRLSYLPFLMLPVGVCLMQGTDRWRKMAAGLFGALLWFVPFVIDTGWNSLIEAAAAQTTGHFTEFGGTVVTDPGLGRRLQAMLESIWADGLGGYWPGRHPVTVVVGVGLAGLAAAGTRQVRRSIPLRVRLLMAGSWMTYALWIFLYQNVIHKPRHVLPLLPFLLVPIGFGLARALQDKYLTVRGTAVLTVAAYLTVTFVLVWQHRHPTAIAQAKTMIEQAEQKHDPLYVGSIPLVNYYMAGQAVDARFLSIENPDDRERLRRVMDHRTALVISEDAPFPERQAARIDTFYHNPYVNRMWPQVKVYTYAP
jgi:4-amino-4-deoxy-L-arabinose transferase-like glycosyltransferase